MREPYVHEATVAMGPDGDGITTHWEFRASKAGALSPGEADRGHRIADA